MSKIVIDSSALIALLLEEPGSEIIGKNLPNAVMSSVNYAEVISVLSKRMKVKDIIELLDGLVEHVEPLTKEDATNIGMLYEQTKKYGLSIGDRACIALGIRLGLPVYTEYKILSELEIDVEIITIR